MQRRQRFIRMFTAWLCLGIIFIPLFNALLEIFFVYSLLGFLALIDVTEPVNLTPRWRYRLRWVVAVGLAGFGYIVIRESLRVLDITVKISPPWL
jgi:hypothetical protein